VDDATARAVRTTLVSRWVGAKAPPLDARPEAPPAAAARPRTVLVERSDAAQTALLLIAPGPGALAPEYAAAALANVPLGGSFTSRLNSNLREDKGYTYGIKSAHLASRLAGAHVVRTAVQREVTAPALTEILREVGLLTADGPRTDEVEKARGTLRVERIETWQTVEGISAEVAQAVGLGVPPTWLGALAQRFEATTDAEVVAATRAMALPGATIIAVGDRATIEAAFEKNGLPKPERRGPSGERL
jgi:predicted Zn-dependent peptidase